MNRKRKTGRRLRLESLEERRMLAVIVVDDDFAADDAAAGHFTTIQAAVNAATAGDKIKVRAGTYEENVVVNKQLTIKGADAKLKNYLDPTKASIVDPVNNSTAGSAAIAFNLPPDALKIEDVTTAEFDSHPDADRMIAIRSAATHAGYTIEDNVIEKNTIGVYLNSSTSTTTTPARTKVEDNLIRDNNRTGANSGNGIFSDLGLQNAKIEDNDFTGANSSTGIRIVGSGGGTTGLPATVQSGITIEDNDFANLSGGGVYFEKVVDSKIDDNDLTNIALSGIQLNGGNQRVTISHNDVRQAGTQNVFGIILSDRGGLGGNQNNVIRKNHIVDSGSSGLVIRDSSSNTIEKNKISGSTSSSAQTATTGNGISLENADNNTLTDNKLRDNDRNGIFVDANSSGNTLTKNNSKNNNAGNLSAFDYTDLSTGGTGTASTQNTYAKNKGRTQNVTGLIAKFI